MNYSKYDLEELQKFYKNQLLNDTIPFWFPRSFDEVNGGYLLMRDQDGSLIDDDKAVWIQGRAAWTAWTHQLGKRQQGMLRNFTVGHRTGRAVYREA